jgi:NADP-dependent 3-hydroxy acid dehydrogenase YdfG
MENRPGHGPTGASDARWRWTSPALARASFSTVATGSGRKRLRVCLTRTCRIPHRSQLTIEAVIREVNQIEEQFGAIDVLVNNAGSSIARLS